MTARDVALALAGRRAQRLADGSYLVPCPVPSHGKGRGDRNPSLRIGDGASRLLVCDTPDQGERHPVEGLRQYLRRARRHRPQCPARPRAGNDRAAPPSGSIRGAESGRAIRTRSHHPPGGQGHIVIRATES